MEKRIIEMYGEKQAKYAWIKRQNMETSMREKRSLVFYNELKSNWEKKLYIAVCTQEARRGKGWWKMGIWRLKGARRNTEQGDVSYV
jgi:CRISPR/Cas system CSM-associated protein Csm2 small subunit